MATSPEQDGPARPSDTAGRPDSPTTEIPGAESPGIVRPGTVPAGAVPPGAVPPGAVPAGTEDLGGDSPRADSQGTDSPRLDSQHPWPGLAPYDEASKDYFHGRDEEVVELLRLIRLAPLTVLYGASGLGKSSLLLAGLFPRLRAERYLPVYLRIDFSERAEHPPLEQAARRLEEEIRNFATDCPPRNPGEDLWRYLHRNDFEIWTADNFPMIPVLVFDQFEEIISRRAGGRREGIAEILDELGDLAENRIPAELTRDETDREQRSRLDLREQRYRVMLSFREDFLPDIEAWKDKMPSLLSNRLRLLPMSRDQAIKATDLAGEAVLDVGVTPRIVDLVTRREAGITTGEPTVEPVLLSLCCTRLNRRRAPGGRIDAALVDSAGEDILEDFYREAIAGMPLRVPEFIEDRLIQGDRYRGSYPRGDAIERGYVTEDELAALTDRYRLLRIDQQPDTARIELIHDRMVEIVRSARDERLARKHEEEEQRLRQKAEQEASDERERREQAERAGARMARLSRKLKAAVVVLVALSIMASLFAWQAIQATDQAKRAARATLELRLVGEALAMLSGALVERPERALLQLLAAHRMAINTDAAESALLKELLQRPQLRKLIATEQFVSAMAFVNGGRQIVATGGDDGTLRVFDSQTGQPVAPAIQGHDGWVWAIAVSPDATRVVSGGNDKTLRLWDAEAGRPIRPREPPMKGHTGAVRSVAFSPDGNFIVSGSDDKTMRLWDGHTGKYLGALLQEHNGPVRAVAFSPDGERIVSGSEDATLRLWDARTRWQIGEPFRGHKEAVLSVAFSVDGQRIVSASNDKTLILWDAATSQPVREPLRGHTGAVLCLAFSPGGEEFASGGWDGTVRRWDARTGDPRGDPLYAHTRGVASVAYSPDKRIASGSDGGGIAVWTPEATASETLGRHAGLVTGVSFSPDGKLIVSASLDKTVRLWNTNATGESASVAELDADAMVWSVAFSADGNRIAAGGDDSLVRLWDAPGGRFIRAFEKVHESMLWSVAFSGDGKRIVSASQDKTVRLWDAETGRHLDPPLQGHEAGVNSAAFSPDGRRIVSGSDDKSVRLWDAETHRQIRLPAMAHEGPVLSVAFSPDGRRIVSGGVDQVLRLWDAQTGEAIGGPFVGHRGKVTSVAFSADGRRIVSGSADGTLRQWDVASGVALGAAFEGHEGRVNSVAISGDGRRILSGSSDHTLRLWPGAAAWPDEVCAKLTRNMSRQQWHDWVSPSDPYACQCPGLPIPGEAHDTGAPPEFCPGAPAGAMSR